MKEDINFRIIKKLHGSKYDKHISGFLIDAIREEYARMESRRWNFKDTYDLLIEKYADKEESKKC